MTAHIIDGKAFAAKVRESVREHVENIKKNHNIAPGLAVILVGEDPASQVYVRNKGKQTLECGMESFSYHLPDTTTQDELLAKVGELNNDPKVHGILVQLPLPKQIDEQAVIQAINPDKDVDGFHVVNAGKLATGQKGLVPCTPYGCYLMLKDYLKDLTGKHAVVIGRSNIVGKPMAQLLLNEGCTVTITHSKTKDIKEITKQADILVAAVGRPEMVDSDWIKQGAVIIDVGINRIERDGKFKLVGDVDFADVQDIPSAITPVPGGVGPMTIACLLRNTLVAFCEQSNLEVPNI